MLFQVKDSVLVPGEVSYLLMESQGDINEVGLSSHHHDVATTELKLARAT